LAARHSGQHVAAGHSGQHEAAGPSGQHVAVEAWQNLLGSLLDCTASDGGGPSLHTGGWAEACCP
jgi:hypothetical protein